MRIASLHLENVGPFRKTTWNLDPSRGFQLFIGPNEAGKSTALRALADALYGFPHTLPDGESFQPYRDRRVGLSLISDDGQQLRFLRRKATKQALRGLDDKTVVDEAELSRWLQQVDRTRFEQFFGLDHVRLVQGGNELLNSKGDIGTILFAGSQLQGAPQILEALSQEAASLFAPRAQNPPINSQIRQHADLMARVNQLMVKPQAWRDVQTEFDQASATKDRLQAQLKELEKRVSHLARLNAACTPARQLRQIRQQLQSYAELPMLDEEFFEQVEAVRQKIFSAAHEQRVKQEELRQLKSTLDQLPPVESIWLEHESTIRELVETRGSIQKARKDTPKVQKELLLAKARQQAILDQWKWAPADQSASIPRKLRKELEALQAEWLVLSERKKALTDRAQALARTTARIASEPVDRRETLRKDLAKTQATLQTATSLLEADQKIRTLRISQTTLERNVAQAWQKLEPQTLMSQWAEAHTLTDQIALLSSTNIPTHDVIEQFREEIDTWHQQVLSAVAALEKAQLEQSHAIEERQRLRTLILQTTPEDLAKARSERDQLWAQFQQQLESEPQPDHQQLIEQAQLVQQSIQQADQLADALFKQATNVYRDQELALRTGQLSTSIQQLQERLTTQKDLESQAVHRWENLWSSTGISPRSPREMLVWSRMAHELIELGEKLAAINDELSAHDQQCEIFCHQFDTSQSIESDAPEPQSLPTIHARLKIDEQNLLERIRAADLLELDRQRLNDDQTAYQHDLEAWQSTSQEWELRWKAAIQATGWEESTTPDELAELLEQFQLLEQTQNSIQKLEERLSGMAEDESTFQERIFEFVRTSIPLEAENLIASFPPVELSQAIETRQNSARVQQAQYQQQQATIKRLTAAVGELGDELELAQEQLNHALQQARLEEPSELTALREKCRLRRKLLEDGVNQELELARQCGTNSVEELIQQALEVDPATLPPEIESLEQEISSLREQLGQATARFEAARLALAGMSGESKAAELNEEASDLRRLMIQDSREYLRLVTAAELLRSAIKTYREQHQGPVFALAASIFTRMTGGVFEGLQIDSEDGSQELLVRCHDGRTLRVTELSTGTADQLFLAIRLAWIEEYLHQHPPFPLVLDDVLVQFDDERTRYALEVLGELSRRTQILCFTHHEHLKELVEQTLDPDQYEIHSLQRLRTPPFKN